MDRFPRPAEGTWTEHHPELGTGPVSFEDSISPALTRGPIVIRAILSFVSADYEHPVVPPVMKLTDPILQPFQRIIPAIGGFDLSPLVAILVLYLAQALIAQPLLDFGAGL